VNLSIISPRKIPALFKLFEKGGGDLPASQTKNYAKDPRHLVLLKGFSLKERPVSPTPAQNQANVMPVANIGSPAPPQPQSQATNQAVFRPNGPPVRPPMGFQQNPNQGGQFRMEQAQMRPGMSPRWQQPQGPNMAPNMMQAQQMRAGMQPQQQPQQQQPNQASTLIAQLQQPPAGVMQQPGINPQFQQQGPRMDG
jgi:mediator of RNA polymerase II transcription subunit 25